MSRSNRSEAYLSQLLARPGYRVASQIGGEVVDTSRPVAPRDAATAPSVATAAATGTLTLPWPPTGNTAVRHANSCHYLNPTVIAYRDAVAALCARFKPVSGRYRLHVHLSPPDARRTDADNRLKTLFDALVKAGYVQDDSLTYMRELVVTTDDERRGKALVRAIPMDAQ
jgi:crossover junction endodeoxyribonuclease RusA